VSVYFLLRSQSVVIYDVILMRTPMFRSTAALDNSEGLVGDLREMLAPRANLCVPD
jgi:hypothetical protein